MDEIKSNDSGVYARLLLGRAVHLLLKARQKELAPFYISAQQVQLLSILHNLGHKATLNELSKYSERGINTISAQITKMEKEGLVKKSRVIPKSTLLCIELTESGLEIYNHTNELKQDKAIMSVLSKEECQKLILMLDKIITRAKKHKTEKF